MTRHVNSLRSFTHSPLLILLLRRNESTDAIIVLKVGAFSLFFSSRNIILFMRPGLFESSYPLAPSQAVRAPVCVLFRGSLSPFANPASLPFAATLCLVLTLARHPTLPPSRQAKLSATPALFPWRPSCSLCVLPGGAPSRQPSLPAFLCSVSVCCSFAPGPRTLWKSPKRA